MAIPAFYDRNGRKIEVGDILSWRAVSGVTVHRPVLRYEHNRALREDCVVVAGGPNGEIPIPRDDAGYMESRRGEA